MKRTPLIRLSYFLWVPALLVLLGAHAAFGLPHALFSYGFQLIGGGDQWDLADRWYTRCTYVGPYGMFSGSAHDGQCPWLVFRRDNDGEGGQ